MKSFLYKKNSHLKVKNPVGIYEVCPVQELHDLLKNQEVDRISQLLDTHPGIGMRTDKILFLLLINIQKWGEPELDF